jgi:hypothetical protein
MPTPSERDVMRPSRRCLVELIDPVVCGVHRKDDQRTAATQVRQHRLDGIQPGIKVPFLGNEHRASKRARHGIPARGFGP